MSLRLVLVALLVMPIAAGAASVDNDDSCDIAVLPAATLLLPWFEVDLDDQNGETTLFTITNVTNVDQIAHVTLWTDRAYPVLNFNIYLTGYDVQSINMYDVLERGIIASAAGTGTMITPKRGTYADPNTTLNLTACDRLPGPLDDAYVVRMQEAFVNGRVPELGLLNGCELAGDRHDNAAGYVTIDVVAECTTDLATDRTYWDAIRYDNVLIGDYLQVNRNENSAQGGPLVHIRAVPEGGSSAVRGAQDERYDAGFERTFYSRFQNPATPRLDGRQPLPSRFATRWIEGGDGQYETDLKIWREGRNGGSVVCETFPANASLDVSEAVVFDEDENAAGSSRLATELPAASRTSVSDAERYPQLANGATSGWLYLDLDRTKGDDIATQNWVVTSMRAHGRFSTAVDAIALGNGCSAPAATSEVTRMHGAQIGPAPNVSARQGVAATNNDDSCDIALLPAATLLLPYFEVDLDSPDATKTLFTLTNVSPRDQIARVTLWTDLAYPVVAFNVFLTGYDVQSIDLRDVIGRGVVASEDGTGSRVTARGEYSDRNRSLDLRDCTRLPGTLAPDLVERMSDAFRLGITEGADACGEAGLVHENAIGYATIDVVRNCSLNLPTSPEYWKNDIAYENVLIGDTHQVSASTNGAQGTPMVHIRAIPEGGGSDAGFPRTFYSRYQSAQTPKLDGRQPLPSVFAARWISGGAASFRTRFNIWREGKTGSGAACAVHDTNLMKFTESVRFDEAENGVGDVPTSRVCTPIYTVELIPAASSTSVEDASVFPLLTNGAVAGWFYLNLDHCELDGHGSQNWVVSTMHAEGRFTAAIEAAALGNGCSAPIGVSEVTTGTTLIGPARNSRP